MTFHWHHLDPWKAVVGSLIHPSAIALFDYSVMFNHHECLNNIHLGLFNQVNVLKVKLVGGLMLRDFRFFRIRFNGNKLTYHFCRGKPSCHCIRSRRRWDCCSTTRMACHHSNQPGRRRSNGASRSWTILQLFRPVGQPSQLPVLPKPLCTLPSLSWGNWRSFRSLPSCTWVFLCKI